MINDFFANTYLFGILLTILSYWFFYWLSNKLRMPLLSPMLCSIAVMIAFLKLCNISYDTYNVSAKILDYLIGPATVAMAIPLYRKFSVLKENAVAILFGTLAGVVASLIVVTAVSLLLNVDAVVFNSLLPKSVTTAVAKEITAELGGNVGLCIICVCITGNVGAAIVKYIPKWFGIKDELSLGVAIGSNSHAMGTSAALEYSQLTGAISSLSLVVASIMMVILAPIVSGLVY